MNILVTGATGFIGSRLWPALQQDGHRVRLLVRSPEKLQATRLRDMIPETRIGDITHPETLLAAVRGMDIVIHAAAALDTEGVSWNTLREVNVLGTKNLLEACQKNGKTLFVYISTTLVTGPNKNGPMTEDAPLDPGPSGYTRSKAIAESALLANKGLHGVIIRLPPLYGPGMRHGWPEVIRQMKSGRFRIIGHAEGHMHLTHIDDVIQGLMLSMRHSKRLKHSIYQLAGPEPIQLCDAFNILAEELGTKPPAGIPVPLALAAAYLLLFVPNPLKPKALRLFRPYRVRYFSQDYVYDTSRATRDFEFHPQITPADGLRALAKDILDAMPNHSPERSHER